MCVRIFYQLDLRASFPAFEFKPITHASVLQFYLAVSCKNFSHTFSKFIVERRINSLCTQYLRMICTLRNRKHTRSHDLYWISNQNLRPHVSAFLGLLFVVSAGHGATNLKGFLGKVYELYSDYVLKVNITICQRAQYHSLIA